MNFRLPAMMGLGMIAMSTHAQSLMDARSLALGSPLPVVKDTREFPSNPAGLTRIRDWDFSISAYAVPSKALNGFVFQGLAIGKRLFENEALAFRYAPGSLLRFVAPPVLTLGNANSPESSDREIEYREPYAFSFAHRFSSQISAGIGVRNRQENVTDTRYQIVYRDSISYPAASTVGFSSTVWLGDLALQWKVTEALSLALAGRNLLQWRRGDDEEVLLTYRLPTRRAAEFGLLYSPGSRLDLLGSLSTEGSGSVGVEWSTDFGLSLRGSISANRREQKTIAAAAAGVGWSYEFFAVDASYLRFFDRENHGGSTSADTFDPDRIVNLDMNPYSRDRIAFTAKAMFGHVRESLARIEGVTISGGVYPASREMLAFAPIGTARVRNISTRPIHARVSLFVERYMDAPTESSPVLLLPGEAEDIPLTAVFNEQVQRVRSLTVRDGNVFVNATPAEEYDDKYQTRILILGRNAWDGDARTLRYFVTPDDPAILRYSRDVLLDHRDSLAGVSTVFERFVKARILLDTFAGKLQYVRDPKLTADYVQYPAETLELRGGDCDDMTVCFASLLSSIGISTAFVDIVPPDAPDKAHIFLLFDTGVEPRFGSAIAGNPKRYVIRRSAGGGETLWIPIETTVIDRGFEEAWTSGAQKYFDSVEIGLGVAHGWVHILDVN